MHSDSRPCRGSRRRRLAGAWLACALVGLTAPSETLAQDVATLTLSGRVVDAATGARVAGASVSVDGQRRATTSDALGAFTLGGVPPGPLLLRVEALGFEDLLVPVEAVAAGPPLELRLEPGPIPLGGIDVTGEARGTLGGVVLDAVTGAGLPWASLWLRDRARASADERGAFRFPLAPTGSYLLLVERLGYESLYVPVRVAAPSAPVVVRLQPDPVLLEGIGVVIDRFENRRNAYPRTVWAFGEDRLGRSAASDVVQFLRHEGGVVLVPCRAGTIGLACVVRRGRTVQPRVYLDETPLICGLDVLASYHPSELFLVEYYVGGQPQIRAYTRDFVERLGRRPRALFPADLPSLGMPNC